MKKLSLILLLLSLVSTACNSSDKDIDNFFRIQFLDDEKDILTEENGHPIAEHIGFKRKNTCPNGPLSNPIPSCNPEMFPSSGDPRQDCVDRINQFRWECQCLPPLQRWKEGEECTDQQALDDSHTHIPHGAFFKYCQGVFAQNECPGWPSWSDVNVNCIKSMWNEGPGEPYHEHGHYINMVNPRYKKVACGSNNGYFIQNFSM